MNSIKKNNPVYFVRAFTNRCYFLRTTTFVHKISGEVCSNLETLIKGRVRFTSFRVTGKKPKINSIKQQSSIFCQILGPLQNGRYFRFNVTCCLLGLCFVRCYGQTHISGHFFFAYMPRLTYFTKGPVSCPRSIRVCAVFAKTDTDRMCTLFRIARCGRHCTSTLDPLDHDVCLTRSNGVCNN